MKLMSKSNYVHGIQCPKMLWMQEHMPGEYDSSWLDIARLGAGTEIGDLARGYFGDYELVTGSFRHLEKMAEKTQALIASGAKVICEATFIANGCVCLVDILRIMPHRRLKIVEVKSSTKVKPEHITDTSFQAAVVASAMPDWEIQSTSLMHIDSSYVRGATLDIHKLFSVEDVTDRLMPAEAVMAKVDELRAYIAQEAEPELGIGKHCNSPHACCFQTYCWSGMEDEICSLAGKGRASGAELMAKGVNTFEDALEKLNLKGIARSQAMSRGRVVWDSPRVEGFLEKLHFPICFLDFETVQSGIPAYAGTKPYQQIPTQYSLHRIDCEGGALHHVEYLAPSEGDPRRGVAEALVWAVPRGACVVAYNMSFERARIREMADAFPDLGRRLMEIHDSIVDLMVPFQKGWIYLPAMGGSYSIKHVLPALFPGDPSLDYSSLEGVHNGAEATQIFLELSRMEPDAQARAREQLLRYCELDTLALVKVWQRLREGNLAA